MWELNANNTVLLYSATLDTGGAQPLFFQALHVPVIGGAFTFTVAAFVLLSAFQLPVMAIYGFVQGIGSMPHGFVPIVIGALPVLAAGYGTGVGLIALIGVAVNLIVNAVSAAPF